MQSIIDIPVEIQEMILFHLSLQDLLRVAKVCKLWYKICCWVAKEKYAHIIPEECMQELKNTGRPQDELWLTAFKYHRLQRLVCNQRLNQSRNIVTELTDKHLSFCSHGPLIFVGSVSGELDVYNSDECNRLVVQLQFQNTPVLHMEVMPAMKLLLVRALVNEIVFVSLPSQSGNTWLYQMKILKPNITGFKGKLFSEISFSVSGRVLASVVDLRQVCVFEVTGVTKDTVQLKYLTNYLTREPISHVSIWEKEVIIIFKSGGILRYYLSTLSSHLSNRYYELHYENPVWIFRGRIFCSTSFSSQLLGYWHMDRGAQYWLMGKPSRDLARCRDLGGMERNDLCGEDVLCVCLKQRLLVCGTRNGKILMYYLSDVFFSSDNFQSHGNYHLTQEFNRTPDLIIKTKERPISNIQIHFDEDSITIYTWPCKMMSRPELKGLLQCIVLKEISLD